MDFTVATWFGGTPPPLGRHARAQEVACRAKSLRVCSSMPFGNFDDSVNTITALSSRSSARWREDCRGRAFPEGASDAAWQRMGVGAKVVALHADAFD